MPITDVLDSDGSNLQTIADTLAKAKKVVIVTGAGISTNSGIPDFRSENGLYSLIQAQYDGAKDNNTTRKPRTRTAQSQAVAPDANRSRSQSRMSGRDMFDARIWQDSLSTEVFYRFIASFRKTVRDDIARTTATHRFIKTMRDGGRLVRCYTQNIDGLEGRDGLNTDLASGKGNKARFSRKAMQKPRPDGPIFPGSDMYGGCEVVQLHGDLELLRCSICQTSREWGSADEELMLLHGESPPCETCLGKDQDRRLRGKRGLPVGFLRPNVVLYGEEHPNADLLSPIITHDLASAPDVLLILGTSLQVHGLKVLVKEFAKAVHARGRGAGKVIFVNNTKPAESAWNGIIDYWVGMDCDTWVTDMRKRRSDIWLRQGELKLPGTAVNKAGGPRTQLERAKEKGLSMKDQALLEEDKENRGGQRKKAKSVCSQHGDPLAEATQNRAGLFVRKDSERKGEQCSAVETSHLQKRRSLRNMAHPAEREDSHQTIIVDDSPSTPQKEKSSPRGHGPVQLLTPPESRQGSRHSTRVKRNHETFQEAECIWNTPSKRHRTVDILAQDALRSETSKSESQSIRKLQSRTRVTRLQPLGDKIPSRKTDQSSDWDSDFLEGIHEYASLPDSMARGKTRHLVRKEGSRHAPAQDLIIID